MGVETYTAKTFSPQRYEIWTMQSAFHNCPTIDGVMQSAGRQFAASDVAYRAGDQGRRTACRTWRRRIRRRPNWSDGTVRCGWIAAATKSRWWTTTRSPEPAKIITLTLMTPCRVTRHGPGKLSLEGTVQIAYDAALSAGH